MAKVLEFQLQHHSFQRTPRTDGKDKNGRDLVDAEEINKRWKDYMEELYKKDLNESITMMVWLVTQSQTFWSVKSSGP